ncbi:MAG: hypothetical protein B7Z26_03890 [Asticcacaulis sp. 32-58-5]|nr:MAG: hypothetical protein B7Z26_03890 [Asticcacaulis sp. 32-58-5]
MTQPTDPVGSPDPIVTTMRLRAQPKPVLRLSRKVLMAGGAVAAVAITAALALAMAPPAPKPSATQAVQAAPVRAPAASDALDALPRDYSVVPKLGPPLPGDLGRPLLAAAEVAPLSSPSEIGGMPLPAAQTLPPSPPSSPSGDTGAGARAAARNSQLFFAQTGSPAAGAQGDPPMMSGMPLPTWPAPTEAPTPKSEAERKADYLNRESDRQGTSEARLTAPVSPYTLFTGSVVPAALITGLRSDLPGQVLAQVTQDVHDSRLGHYLLIPKGARLIGQYDNQINVGQSRVLLVWTRLILPNGKSLALDKLSAADARGYAGLTDSVDNHWNAVVNAAAISTLLGIGAQTGDTQNDSDLLRAIRDGAADSVNRAGQRIVERQLSVQPTLSIRAGMPVRVILSRDLVLEPYGD